VTPRERILAVYQHATPDQIPFMLDLSHWFYHKNRLPWDLSKSYDKPEYELIDYHKRMAVGFYVPNLGLFFETHYPADVKVTTQKSNDQQRITWTLETPLGTIRRTRIWDDQTYSWSIKDWSVKNEEDLRIFAYAMSNRSFRPCWDKYRAWVDYVGDVGVVYLLPGYSAMGHLLGYWMGIEAAIYATLDYPATVREVVDRINDNTLALIDLLASSPAEIICMGDNFSSDIQPPRFYSEWSRPYDVEAISRLHQAGKFVAVHIDGRLSGALEMIRESGADCADAVTPTPMGDLTPQQCRQAAGTDFILSGGVSPDVWLPDVSVRSFKQAVLDWLELKKHGPRLIAAAGDQVPPGADEDRIEIMRDLVDKHGQY